MSYTKLLTISLLLLALGGCSSVGKLVGLSDDDTIKPKELNDITTEIKVTTLWSVDVGVGTEGYALFPAIWKDKVFAADHDGKVVAMSADSGTSLWQVDLGELVSAGPGVGHHSVVVGTQEAEVIALSTEDGKERWRTRVSSIVLAPPQISDGIVVVRTIDGKLFALDADTGVQLWSYSQGVPVLSLRGTSAPVISTDAVISGFDGGRLVALSLADGKTFWTKRISTPKGRTDIERMIDIDAPPVVMEDGVYVVNYQGRVAALDLFSGKVLWKREMSSYSGLDVDAKNLYISDTDSYVWALDRFNGASVWRQKDLYKRKLTAPVAFGDTVVVGDYEGYLHWLSKDDGRFIARSKIDGSGISSSPVVYNNTLYVYGNSGQLVALKADYLN